MKGIPQKDQFSNLLIIHDDRTKEIPTVKEVCKCDLNRPFSKMAAENSNNLKLKTYTSTGKSTFTLVTLQSFSISGVISAEKM